MKCETKGCRMSRQKSRRICRGCRYAKEKQNLVAWSYRTLKANAKRRGKLFTLTLEEFADFCYLTSLLTNRGTKSSSYTVDRIDNNFGYHVGNIQVLTNRENIKKEKILSYDYQSRLATVTPKLVFNNEEYPF